VRLTFKVKAVALGPKANKNDCHKKTKLWTMADDEAMAGMADEATSANGDDSTGEVVIGSAALRPVFLGNLVPNYSTDQVTSMFENPSQLRLEREFKSIPVDRIDVKRGYCFVFLKDAETQADKEQIEAFVVAINGM
jgi:hypothetical protein